jgi:hypothetical protein
MVIKVYKTIISLVLYGRATWYCKVGEVHRWRVFEKRVLRKIVEPERKEITR